MEHVDLGFNLKNAVDAWNAWYYPEEDNEPKPVERKPRKPVDKSFFEVRKNAVCVIGLNREAVRDIKNQIGTLFSEPIPLESLHVKSPSDIKDGAILVPKLVLVAAHCPGKKLLDEQGDEGQLDFLYDEACDLGCDIMVIYVGLPKLIYPSNKHAIYHPKMEDMVFPTSPLLRSLASENCFFTITDSTKLSSKQKNILREWITKPVGSNHPVFEAADYLSSTEMSTNDQKNQGKTDHNDNIDEQGASSPAILTFADEHEVSFEPAKDESDKKKRKKKKKDKFSFRKRKEDYAYENDPDLITLDEEPTSKGQNSSIELDMYKESGVASGTSSSVMF